MSKRVDGCSTAGVIVWSIAFGVALRNLGESGRVLVEVILTLKEATKHVVKMIIGYGNGEILGQISVRSSKSHQVTQLSLQNCSRHSPVCCFLSSFLPIGVLFMTASYVMDVSDNWDTVIKLGMFVAVVMSGYVSFGFLALLLSCRIISFLIVHYQYLFFSPGLLSMGW